jgi:hypothetical protein
MLRVELLESQEPCAPVSDVVRLYVEEYNRINRAVLASQARAVCDARLWKCQNSKG